MCERGACCHPVSRYGGEAATEEPMIMEFMRLDAERKNPPSELQSRSCDHSVMSHDVT